MANDRIGVTVMAADVKGVLDTIVRAEEAGIPNAWLTSGGPAPDPLAIFAVASTRTERIRFGTSIVPTWPRHPIALVQQVAVVEDLAPGRLRLGVGPSHRPMIEAVFGFEWRSPHGRLREYVRILRALLQKGEVDFDGRFYHAHTRIARPLGTPVLISALREKGFRLGGEEADGVITWVCPASYVREVALPNVEAAAKSSGRETPVVVMHTPICVHEDVSAVREAAREQLGFYPRVPYYAAMFADSGYPDAPQGLSDALIDALVIHGDEAKVAEGVRALLAMGVEVLAHPIGAGADKAESVRRATRLLGEVARS